MKSFILLMYLVSSFAGASLIQSAEKGKQSMSWLVEHVLIVNPSPVVKLNRTSRVVGGGRQRLGNDLFSYLSRSDSSQIDCSGDDFALGIISDARRGINAVISAAVSHLLTKHFNVLRPTIGSVRLMSTTIGYANIVCRSVSRILNHQSQLTAPSVQRSLCGYVRSLGLDRIRDLLGQMALLFINAAPLQTDEDRIDNQNSSRNDVCGDQDPVLADLRSLKRLSFIVLFALLTLTCATGLVASLNLALNDWNWRDLCSAGLLLGLGFLFCWLCIRTWEQKSPYNKVFPHDANCNTNSLHTLDKQDKM